MMNNSLADNMRAERKSPAVLRIGLLKSFENHNLVFVFEGQEDYSVYEALFSKSNFQHEFGYIPGKGKEQLVGLLNQLIDKNEGNYLDKTVFFVDQDYDLEQHVAKNIYTLKAYSIENLLWNKKVVNSILCDEFKLSAEQYEIKEEFQTKLNTDYNNFSILARDICLNLFIIKNSDLQYNFPDSLKRFINIKYNNIIKKIDFAPDVLEEIDDFKQKNPELVHYYQSLPDEMAIRGKYILEFIKEWMGSLIEYIRSTPELSEISSKIKISNDFINMRRLGSACPQVVSLTKFLSSLDLQQTA